MRDDDATGPLPGSSTEPLPRAVARQPDPMLDEQPANWFRVAITTLGAAVVVGLVLYGLTRPSEPQQTASSSEPAQTAPAGGGAANNAGDQAQPANAAAQKPQPNAQAPTTTGQGPGEHAGPPDAGQTQPKGQADQSKIPPAAGGSATTATGLGAKPPPQAK